jgi:hypothetical protein
MNLEWSDTHVHNDRMRDKKKKEEAITFDSYQAVSWNTMLYMYNTSLHQIFDICLPYKL